MAEITPKIRKNIQFALSVVHERRPEAPWYGVWGPVLEQLTTPDDDLSVFAQPALQPEFTTRYRIPDFGIYEVMENLGTHETTRQITVIMEIKAPIAPHTPHDFRDDGNIGIFETAEEQLDLQAAYAFASAEGGGVLIGIVGVGCLWRWMLYKAAAVVPVQGWGEDDEAFIVRHLGGREVTSGLFYLGAEDSSTELGRLRSLLEE
ncbi:hypothetical protein BS47DRAFT_1362058 [Hydnum rufescens UP504]|uniref:Uncharacterized protein n=1 Tax=Hydnum rufescens UP504 TaxID=1448309 RepID=A0A9P6AY65_9AGAM|nr:hypothetical protein BS47DRAFT_1362058 [Hydnum rufescens UP504]